MQSPRIDLEFSTNHVSYFKKLIANQYALCSDIKMKYDKQKLIFYANSTTENVFLTMNMTMPFFDMYSCTTPNVIRLNIYHFYKIIKRITSFRYKSIQLFVYEEEEQTQCHWIHITFHTENRTDTYHTRGYSTNEDRFLVFPSHASPSSDILQMNINGRTFSHALHQFDDDMFKTLQFSLQLNPTNKCELYVKPTHDHHLLLKGRTDVISGKVIIKTKMKVQLYDDMLQKLKRQHYSLCFLRKSLQFFKLSDKSTFTLTFYPEFKVLMLLFKLPYHVNVEIVLPDIPCEGWSDNVFSSDADSDDYGM